MSQTAFVITKGQYSNYRVCAVFLTREAAEAQLHAYEGSTYEPPSIEEFPLEPEFPTLAEGFELYEVLREQGELSAAVEDCMDEWCGESIRKMDWGSRGDVLQTGVIARDEAHAIKIAAERFAQYDAQQAGIA